MNKSKILKELILSEETLVMPDAYDELSAKIIELMGYKAVQCSGYSFSIAALKKDEIEIGFKENLAKTSKIIQALSVPVMADGEDGFGGVEQIPDTIRSYIKAGTAGINLEDQNFDKLANSMVIDSKTMIEKIKVARKTAIEAGNPDFIINGRTDALVSLSTRQEGLAESIKRANLYLEAGADLAFVVKVKTLEEAKILVKEINGPLSIAAGLPYNINNFSINELKDIGVARVSLPTIAIQATIKALMHSLGELKAGQFSELVKNGALCSIEDIDNVIG
jgi:2-methylisocitrate lyase-like PEP mutase family enzyme